MKLLKLFILLFIISSCGSQEQSSNEKVLERLSTVELQQFTNGKKLYGLHCQNCHMENGEGLGKLIPPLKGADFLMEYPSLAAKGIKYGMERRIQVNGTVYNQPMPANSKLTDVEIYEIMVYISNAWDNEAELDQQVILKALK